MPLLAEGASVDVSFNGDSTLTIEAPGGFYEVQYPVGNTVFRGSDTRRNFDFKSGVARVVAVTRGLSYFVAKDSSASGQQSAGVVAGDHLLQIAAADWQHWQPSAAQDYPTIAAPTIVSGSYTPAAGGSGGAFVYLGFDPDFVIVKSDSVQLPVWRGRCNWYDRTDHFTAELSKNLITSFRDGGFTVNNNAKVGAAGVKYYYVAVKDNGSGILAQTNLFGNGKTGRVFGGWLASRPPLLWIKRDNANAMVCNSASHAAGVAARADGQGASPGVQAVASDGTITLGANAEVNELDGPAGFGEGTGFLAWYGSDWSHISSYTGDGTASRAIALPWQPEFVWVHRNDGVTKGAQWTCAAMPSGTSCPVSNAAAALTTGGRMTITSSGVTVNNDTGVNASGVVYTILALRRSDARPLTLPALPLARKAIELSGAGSYIDCGTSDSLRLIGNASIEWLGAVQWPDYAGADLPLIVRASGDAAGPGTSGQVSWGMTAYQRALSDVFAPQTAVDYKGWALRVICSTFFDLYETGNANPEAATNWDIRYSPMNTGLLVYEAVRQHWIITHTSPGSWRVYLNGELVKVRDIDMVTELNAQNLNSPSGHRTVIGARAVAGGAQIKNSARMRFEVARVYSRALTAAEARQRYRRALLGQPVADVSTGLVEEWDARNAEGSTLLATMNSANNGNIVGGVVVTF